MTLATHPLTHPLDGPLADPLAGRAVARGVRQIAWAAAAAAWFVSVLNTVGYPGFYPPWYAVIVPAALGLPLVAAWLDRRALDGPVRALQAFVLVGLAVRLADPWFSSRPPGSTDYPPLIHVISGAMVLTGVVFGPRIGVPMVLLGCGVEWAERLVVVGFAQALAETAVFASAGLASFVLVTTIRGELDRLAAATAAALDAQARAAHAARRSAAQQRLDGLIHDKVLAALTLAARGQSADAAGLADDALRSLAPEASNPPPGPVDSGAIIADHARALGLELTMTAEAWPEGPAGDALRAATCEALTNVFRHAGVRAASVRAYHRGAVFVVEVSDLGVGFDPESIPAGRLGVRERIVGSLAAIGGQARFESRRGAGTRVIMASPDHAVALPAGEHWLPAVLVRVAPVLALSIGGHLAAGSLHIGDGELAWVSTLGAVAIPVLAVLLGFLPTTGRLWRPTVGATALTWAGLLANVADPSVGDWRFWFVGAFDSHLALISARRGVRPALLVVVLATALGWAGLVARGRPDVGPLLLASFQSVAWAVCIGWLKAAADRASRRTGEAMRVRQLAEVEDAAATALQAEIAARQHALDADVIPLLTTIAKGVALSDAERARCREVEAATRDQLVAATLLTPELAAALADARARGCRVTITGRAEPGPGLDAFRASATDLLRLARPKDRITLRWAPDAGALATCVLVGPDAGVRWGRAPGPDAAAHSAASVEASVDADSILLVIRGAAPQSGGYTDPPGPR